MKKLNTTNKLYAAILVLLTIATTVKLLRYKGWERYYYSASCSSPRSYPVYVRNSYFILGDGDHAPVGTSEVNDNRNDWGYGDYNHSDTKKRLPLKLVLEYASYRDSSFYADTIPLPVKAIHHAFENMSDKGINTSVYHAPAVKRLDFVIGIANKGNIIVWLQGKNYETTLLKHKIVPHEPVGDDTYHNGRLSKQQYFKEVFFIDSAAKADFKKGLDKTANYIDTPSQFKLRLQNFEKDNNAAH